MFRAHILGLSSVEQIIRLVANLSIHREIGPQIASNAAMETLVHLLTTTTSQSSLSLTGVNEELMLNVVGALTNLSYYMECTENIVISNAVEIAENLSRLLVSDNDECVVETLRAFGNLSRLDCIRHLMFSKHRLRCSFGTAFISLSSTYVLLIEF